MNDLVTTNFNDLTLQELEDFGKDVQLEISDTMDGILQKTRCIDLGSTGLEINNLSSMTNQVTKRLSGRGVLSPFVRAQKWLGKYDNIDNTLSNIGKNIEQEQVKLNTILNGLITSKDVLEEKLVKLKDLETALMGYVNELRLQDGTDTLRLQASVNRLKILSTLTAVTQQEVAKTELVIQENKEITSQLQNAVTNLLPMFKIQMMTTLATKAHREALDLKKNMTKIGNKMIVDNAKEIERAADDLLEGRVTSLISVDSIQEANKILQNTLTKVLNSSKTEVATNLKLIEGLQASSLRLKDLSIEEKN